MHFELTILGSNAAIPAYDRYPSSQILNYNGDLFMIDCGEGSQYRMTKFNIKRGRLDHIFISHLHGDHFFGLVGLLTSFNLNWREHPLHIYGPPGIEEIVNLHFKHSRTLLKFEILYHPTEAESPVKIMNDHNLEVETIILKHRIPTTGFLFREKAQLRNIIPEKITEYSIPYSAIPLIKSGRDFIDENGNMISNTELTQGPQAPRSYAYCSDTLYTEGFIEQIKGVDMLYHEATFIEEHVVRATETFHSTAKQAAKVAKLAGVNKLLIGHFSARYQNLDTLLDEAREIFPETYLAEEGKTFVI